MINNNQMDHQKIDRLLFVYVLTPNHLNVRHIEHCGHHSTSYEWSSKFTATDGHQHSQPHVLYRIQSLSFLIHSHMMFYYLISFTYSRIWLKFVFLPTVSLHAAPMQKRVLPASFACQNMSKRSGHH